MYRSFFHQHIIGGVNRKRQINRCPKLCRVVERLSTVESLRLNLHASLSMIGYN